MFDRLNYESTHTQMSYILYFFKISNLPTLKGQCGLEGIVIKLLPGINQYHSMLLCQEEWGPIDTEKVTINHLRTGFEALILS